MGFWRFQPKFGHALSTTVNGGKSAQNCPNFSKSAQRWNFEIPPKIEILVFFKKKKFMYRGGTRACFYHSDFQSKIFRMLFLLSKNGLCMWISAYPFAKNNFFGNPPQLWWIWDFAHMYLTQTRIRYEVQQPICTSKNGFFGLQNTVVPLGRTGKKLFIWLWTLWSRKR
jgi:hypothetical protein